MPARTDELIGHGLVPSEARVMDLWDKGLSNRDIARQLGMALSTVRQITKIYHTPEDGQAARDAAMANIRFIDRMRAIYPWRFGTATLDDDGAGEGLVA
ncbi:hypothetical protein GV829_04570 [Sphingomonas lacunae]|uniref:Uncharacterized protein n=1 Tax=Sphingomonas lacunae TaxID=2698828 RepID=A0A6M4AUR6_9SPHN|nr:helix-turn-helix domain-containing protein [Sphingomonas lacunae]QJQ31809.1 hypothetical protein GV829_04570 [Sphingomonas lacunae]